MTAPAQFRRITPETEITAPCVLARKTKWGSAWYIEAFGDAHALNREISFGDWTHWLPIQWPEARG